MSLEKAINKRYSRLLLHYPWIVILCVSALCLILTMLGLICTDMPDFSDPAKGFYARGTGTMTGKLLILKAVIERMQQNSTNLQRINVPPVDPDDLCLDDLSEPILTQEQDDGRECVILSKDSSTHWPTLKFKPVSRECLMTSGELKKLTPGLVNSSSLSFHYCNDVPSLNTAYEFYFKVKKKVPFVQLMERLCLKEDELYKRFSNSAIKCRYSLAGLGADLFNLTSCSQMSNQQWRQFEQLLKMCLPLARSGILHHLNKGRAYISFNSLCRNPCFSGAMHFALDMGVDMYYTAKEDCLRTLSIWVPLNTDTIRRQATEEFSRLKNMDDDSILHLEAVNLANSRFYTAMQSIRSDMYLIGLAIFSILFISLIYTKSVVVCLITVYNVALSLGCAYSTYKLVLRISIFPYINLMGAFLLIGLSCDNVFVFDDIWLNELARSEDALSVVGCTLRHASVALFVTSCTTSAAFFTNLFSQIVYIKMFGLYLGLSIIFLFVVSVTILPAALVITHQNTSKPNCEQMCLTDGIPKYLSCKPTVNVRMWACLKRIRQALTPTRPTTGVQTMEKKPSTINTLQKKMECLSLNLQKAVFERFLPSVIIQNCKLLLAMFTLFGLIGMVAVFGWPRMKFPASSRHRFFSKPDHLMEWFEFHTRDDFRAYYDVHLEQVSNPQLIFIWGIESRDDVKLLYPESSPQIVPTSPKLNLFDPMTLIWLDEFVCSFLNSSTMFVEYEPLFNQWSLYRSLLANPNTSSFNRDVLCSSRDNLCFGPPADIEKRYRRLRNSTVRDAQRRGSQSAAAQFIAQMKIFFLEQNDFHAFAFLIRANTTVSQFKNTKDYVDKLDSRLAWFKAYAPDQFRHCWYASRALALFDMQRLIGQGTFQSLIAAVVIVAIALLATTANPLITLLSIITISFILADTIAVFVLSGWTLNFMETIIIITAVGLSVDFTVHYGVAFLHAPEETGQELCSLNLCCHRSSGQKEKKEANLRATMDRVGPAVLMSALTTFLAGLSMSPSRLTSFSQMGFFLMLIMVVSWTFATFFFLPLCLVFGPTVHWGTLNLSACCTSIRNGLFRKKKPDESKELSELHR